jgi:hypothetical protein
VPRIALTLVLATTIWAQELHVDSPRTRYFLGEMIPLKLAFRAPAGAFVADSRIQDRGGRLNGVEEYVVEPAGAQDPLRGLPGESAGMGGISGGAVGLHPDRPFVVERILNEWIRFRSPGRYQLTVRSRRVRPAAGREPVEVTSKPLMLEIEAAPPEWVAGQIKAAVAIADRQDSSPRARQQALLRLRFLNTLEAATELAQRLPLENSVDAFAVHCGMLDSSHRPRLLPVLEARLQDARQPVTGRFLQTLAQLAVLVESAGVPPPYPAQPGSQRLWRADQRRRETLYAEKFDAYLLMLVARLPDKDAAARALTAAALLRIADSRPGQPPWLPLVADALIANFNLLPSNMQSDLLSERWELLSRREVLPLLLALFETEDPALPGTAGLRGAALFRIFDVDPAKARELVLAEIRRPEGPRVPEHLLLNLPDDRLPELDAVFVQQLARGGPPPGLFIARYATRAIVKEVERAYLAHQVQLDRQKLPRCPYPLVFYFLKFDPEFGEPEYRKGLADPRCAAVGAAAEPLGRQAMSQELERLSIEALKTGSPAVKQGVAHLLGRFGSPDAEQSLWDAMAASAAEPAADARWESVLIAALGQAGGWYVGPAKLEQLQALCRTANCRATVGHWIRQSESPKRVEILAYSGQPRIHVAQYLLTNEPELRRKLAQFPRGTTFRMAPSNSPEARQKVELLIRSAGLRVEN